MKQMIFAIVIMAGLAAGCTTYNKPQTSMAPSPLDVTAPGPAMPEPVTSYTPSPAPTLAAPDTVMPAPATPAYSTAATGATGSTYVVKKGDTLYRIARERYGDGKQWQRIASANPGVSPQSLKVGQNLIIP